MIPRIVHYCWVSNNPMPVDIRQCIRSWKRVLPDYRLRLWDAKSFDWDSVSFVREAMAAHKWAFVADYIRLYALYTEGGIYLDSDVEALKRFDNLLNNQLFFGTEAYYDGSEVKYRIEPAVMGAEKGNPFIKQCIEVYNRSSFIMGEQGVLSPVMPEVLSRQAEPLGYVRTDKEQVLHGGVHIYPTSYFTNRLVPNINHNSYAIHHNAASWVDYRYRGGLYRLCRKLGLMNLYHKIECLNKRKRS